MKGETQWNDAQIRFGHYDSTTKDMYYALPDAPDDDQSGSNSGEEFGASADLQLDKEIFTFIFNQPGKASDSFSADDANDDAKVRIELQGYQPKSNVTYCSTGLTTWPAAENLCDHLVKAPTLIRGKRTLELGSGLGLCGLLTHRLTDQHAVVHLTDGDTDALHHLRKNISMNSNSSNKDSGCRNDESSRSALLCDQLLWSRENATQFLKAKAKNKKFDVILASDIIYALNVVDPMWETVQTLLRRDGIFLFAFARRQVAVSIQQVVEAGEKAGFEYEECEETDKDQNLFVYAFRWKRSHA